MILEQLKEMDASETMLKRLNAKEVITPESGEKYIFPIRGERHQDFLGESG